MTVKLSVEEQKEIVSDEAVRVGFLKREDIAPLPPDEQERRWQEHLVGLNRFREWLTQLDSIVLS